MAFEIFYAQFIPLVVSNAHARARLYVYIHSIILPTLTIIYLYSFILSYLQFF